MDNSRREKLGDNFTALMVLVDKLGLGDAFGATVYISADETSVFRVSARNLMSSQQREIMDRCSAYPLSDNEFRCHLKGERDFADLHIYETSEDDVTVRVEIEAWLTLNPETSAGDS